MWEQMELDFTAPNTRRGVLERELAKYGNPNAYITDTKMGYKILVRDCERCNRGADEDIISHYNCEGATFHGAHCTRNSCF